MKKRTITCCLLVLALLGNANYAQAPTQTAVITAIKAGRLIDPETGVAATDQVIIIEGEKIKAVGANLAIPAGATVIDLSKLTRAAWSRRCAHAHGDHLQRAAGEQLLLPDLRHGFDAVARDSGRVQRHSASQFGLHRHS